MSDQESKAQVIEKIRKLLRLAKSTNIHEAELAAERASHLMEKWRVSAASVQEMSDIQSGREKIISVPFVVPNCKMKLKWVESLGFACALLFDGTILVNAHLHGTSWKWVGFEKEIPMMQDLFLHLWSAYPGIAESDLVIAKRQHKEKMSAAYGVPVDEESSLFNFTPAETMKFKHGHGQGFTLALVRRCGALADARKRAVNLSTGTELVLVRDGALTAWKTKNGIVQAKHKQTQGDSRGFASGYQRGNAIALGGQLQ